MVNTASLDQFNKQIEQFTAQAKTSWELITQNVWNLITGYLYKSILHICNIHVESQ